MEFCESVRCEETTAPAVTAAVDETEQEQGAMAVYTFAFIIVASVLVLYGLVFFLTVPRHCFHCAQIIAWSIIDRRRVKRWQERKGEPDENRSQIKFRYSFDP
jgi:hypothetical protein